MKKIVSHVWIWLIIGCLYLPILILAFYSFTEGRMIGEMSGFSIANYITLFSEPELVSMMSGTLFLALGVALLSTILGSLGAIGVYYSKKGVNVMAGLLNQIPVVNADVVTGFSICIMFIIIFGVDKTTFIPLVVGQMVLCTPFVFLSVLPRLKEMDEARYEAALDLGCKPLSAIWNIVVPQIFPGIISGFSLAITLSLDDYFIASYTKPATFDTISTYVVNATRGAQTSIKTALWALSTVIFVVVVLCVYVSNIKGKDDHEK